MVDVGAQGRKLGMLFHLTAKHGSLIRQRLHGHGVSQTHRHNLKRCTFEVRQVSGTALANNG